MALPGDRLKVRIEMDHGSEVLTLTCGVDARVVAGTGRLAWMKGKTRDDLRRHVVSKRWRAVVVGRFDAAGRFTEAGPDDRL